MVSYWLGRYDSLSELTHATGPQAPSDPAILFMSANAAYRTADPLARATGKRRSSGSTA